MTLPIKELRAKAEAATQPGPWTVREDVTPSKWGADYDHVVIDRDSMWVAECGEDAEQAAFVAAASPDVVLSLLDECDRLSALHDELLKSRSEGTRLAFEMADAAKSENDRLRALLDEACDLAMNERWTSKPVEYRAEMVRRIHEIRAELAGKERGE